MTAVPETELARTISDAGRSVRPRRAVVGVDFDAGTDSILGVWPLCAPSGRDDGVNRRLGGVRGALVRTAGAVAVDDLDPVAADRRELGVVGARSDKWSPGYRTNPDRMAISSMPRGIWPGAGTITSILFANSIPEVRGEFQLVRQGGKTVVLRLYAEVDICPKFFGPGPGAEQADDGMLAEKRFAKTTISVRCVSVSLMTGTVLGGFPLEYGLYAGAKERGAKARERSYDWSSNREDGRLRSDVGRR